MWTGEESQYKMHKQFKFQAKMYSLLSSEEVRGHSGLRHQGRLIKWADQSDNREAEGM